MDEGEIARLYRAGLRQARRKWLTDPAIEPEDVVQAAWAKALPAMPGVPTEEERVALMRWAVNMVAIDHAKRAMRRRRESLDAILPAGASAEGEAIARAELGPILDRAVAGERGVLALVLLACGLTWAETTAAARVSRRALHAWAADREGALA